MEMDVEIAGMKEQIKTLFEHNKKQEVLISSIQDLTVSVRIMADRMKGMEDTQTTMKNDLDELKNKPAKRWDGIVDKILLTIAAALVGAVLGRLGL